MTQTEPGKRLAAAVTVGLKLPFQRDAALGADRERCSILPCAKKDDLGNRHGNAERKLLWLWNSGNTQKLVRSQPETKADIFENAKGGTTLSANDPAKIAGGTAAALSSALVAELVEVAKLKKGNGKIV